VFQDGISIGGSANHELWQEMSTEEKWQKICRRRTPSLLACRPPIRRRAHLRRSREPQPHSQQPNPPALAAPGSGIQKLPARGRPAGHERAARPRTFGPPLPTSRAPPVRREYLLASTGHFPAEGNEPRRWSCILVITRAGFFRFQERFLDRSRLPLG
jgi:hypothetical protein